MMHLFSVIHRGDDLSKEIALKVKENLETWMTYDEKNPELVISVGGDGTMLEAIHSYMHCLDSTYFLGIHTGTLGFYTDYEDEELEVMIQDIKQQNYTIDKRNLLSVKVHDEQFYALNEIRLEQNHRTMVCDVLINGEYLECFRGNGLCICTPSGSTAYNRSLNGAIVEPSFFSMQLSEIAGIHHNAYRSLFSSLILDEEAKIVLNPRQSEGTIVGIDKKTIPYNSAKTLEITIPKDKHVQFIHFRPVSLIQRLRRSFISE